MNYDDPGDSQDYSKLVKQLCEQNIKDTNRFIENMTEILQLKQELKDKTEALEKIEDPRKIGHSEPDLYTKIGCLQNIAHEVLEKYRKK